MRLTVRRVLVYIQVARLRLANTSTRHNRLNKQKGVKHPQNRLKKTYQKREENKAEEKGVGWKKIFYHLQYLILSFFCSFLEKQWSHLLDHTVLYHTFANKSRRSLVCHQ